MFINDTPFPTEEVYLCSQFGIKYNSNDNPYHNDLFFLFAEPIVKVSNSYNLVVSITSVNIPLNYPNISSKLNNNQLNLTVGSHTYQVILNDGIYNINDIVDAVNTAINGSGVLMSYDRITGFVSFSSTSSFSITTNDLKNILGINDGSGYQIKSYRRVDVRRTTNIWIRIPELIVDSFDSVNGSRSSIIARVPININQSSKHANTVVWVNQAQYKTQVQTKMIKSLHIQLLDDNRQLLPLESPWSINLEIDVVSQKADLTHTAKMFIQNGQLVDVSSD